MRKKSAIKYLKDTPNKKKVKLNNSLVSDKIDHYLDLGQTKQCLLYVALHDICSLMEFGNQNLTTLVATLRIPNWFPIQYYYVT